ncbi:hypothetical protein [uncultured Rikenella sp.]|uniref:YncE family protein n=1 Tax=uncultured Rikenella sp. TaxID=368003 RepID=UPI0025F8794F|nr:hypothetical protein [uncultured Rikenella sp.]
MKNLKLLTALSAALLLFGCKDDKGPKVPPPHEPTETVGYYILNEGTWGVENSASIAYYQLSDKQLTAGYFSQQNGGAHIGGTPSALEIYGSKMYCTVLEDNAVLVMNAADGKLVKTLTVDRPRSLACSGGRVYVSSYKGEVVRIDTLTLTVNGTAPVNGEYCEGIAVLNDKIYVANDATKGGMQGSGNTVSVIDIDAFQEVSQIETPVNPTALLAGSDGFLYLVTSGDWMTVDAQLHRIDPQKNEVVYTFPDLMASKIATYGDYIYTSHFSYIVFESAVKKVNIKTNEVTTFIADEPVYYGVATNPLSGEIFYLGEGGTVDCYNAAGDKLYTLGNVGLRPNSMAFLLR